MRFNTKARTEAEIKAMTIWPAGTYEFKILEINYFDRNGNKLMGGQNKQFPKVQILLRIWDENEKSKTIYDDLIDCDSPFFIKKMRHIFHSVGLGDVYDRNEHDSDFLLDKSGWLKLGISTESEYNGKIYPEKNTVLDYIVPETLSIEKKEDEFNDDIPTF